MSTETVFCSDMQLNFFTDASQCAITGCIYFRVSNQSHQKASFIIGRTKVAPPNQASIPELELQAAVSGAL